MAEGHLERTELILLTRQFGGMLDAGIDVLRILEVLAEQFANPKVKRILKSVERDMRLGRMLSTALGRFPEVFSPFYLNMVRQGELEGSIAIAFTKVAEHLTRGGLEPEHQIGGSTGVGALVDRVTPIAFWLALSLAVTLLATAGLWYGTLADIFPPRLLGPNVLLLVGVFTLVSSLLFHRLRPKQWNACTFCGRPEHTVVFLRRAANGAICNHCIESSHLAWQAKRPSEAPSEGFEPAPTPAGQDEIEVRHVPSHDELEDEEEEIIGDEFEVVDEKGKFGLPRE